MRRIVSQNLPHTSAEITFEDGYPAMSPTEGNLRLLHMLNQASLDLGYPEVTALDPGQRGAGDISFVADKVDCLDGWEPPAKGATHRMKTSICRPCRNSFSGPLS